MKKILSLILLPALLLPAGCLKTSKYMKVATNTGAAIADASKATVVFYRPNIYAGSAIQSSVYDVTKAENNIIGILPSGNKIIYTANPGESLFMIVGENADFLKLNLEAGKMYYAKVITAMGAFKARFHLLEVSEKELSDPKFKKALDEAVILEKSEETEKWAKDNEKSIQSKREKYIKKWNEKNEKVKE